MTHSAHLAPSGTLYATRHVSPLKASIAGATAAAATVLGAVAGASMLTATGSAPAASWAWGAWAAEAAAAALIGGALAGSWAKGLAQAAKNKTAMEQVCACAGGSDRSG